MNNMGSINHAKEQTIYKQFKDSLQHENEDYGDGQTLYSYWIYVKTDKLNGIVSIHSENKELDEYELDEEFTKEYYQCVRDLKGR